MRRRSMTSCWVTTQTYVLGTAARCEEWSRFSSNAKKEIWRSAALFSCFWQQLSSEGWQICKSEATFGIVEWTLAAVQTTSLSRFIFYVVCVLINELFTTTKWSMSSSERVSDLVNVVQNAVSRAGHVSVDDEDFQSTLSTTRSSLKSYR